MQMKNWRQEALIKISAGRGSLNYEQVMIFLSVSTSLNLLSFIKKKSKLG